MHRRTAGDDYQPRYASSAASPDASIEVDIAHVGEYDAALLGLLLGSPASVIPPFEMGAADALKTLLFDLRAAHNRTDGGDDADADVTGEQGLTQEGDEAAGIGQAGPDGEQENRPSSEFQDEFSFDGTSIQIMIRGNLTPTPLRHIQSKHMNALLRCPGIVISASRVRSRAHTIKIRCSRCQDERTVHSTSGPFGGVAIPQRCMGEWIP